MNRLSVFIISIFLISHMAVAQEAGKTGMSFLKLGAGARNIALGDNGTVFSGDASSVFYNPANLTIGDGNDVLLMHNAWIQDISSEIIAAKLQIGGLPIGIGINSTSVKDIEIRNRPGEREGTFNAQYFMGSLSTAMQLTEKISAGATVKYLYEGYFDQAANGFALDFGVTYKELYDKLSLSGSLKNLGSMDELDNEVTKLPAELRIGAIYPIGSVGSGINLSAGAELQKYLDYDDMHINLGVEAVYDGMLAVRAGYMTMYEVKSFTGGFGVTWKNIVVDYATTPFSLELGTAHTFSVRIGF